MPPSWNTSKSSKPWPSCCLRKGRAGNHDGPRDPRQVEIDILMLPPGEDMHGGRVRSPAPRQGPSAALPNPSQRVHTPRVPGRSKPDAGQLQNLPTLVPNEKSNAPHRPPPTGELVIILTVFAEQGGGADRAPGLPPERLDVPDICGRSVPCNKRSSTPVRTRRSFWLEARPTRRR